jgi:hypothetical protein
VEARAAISRGRHVAGEARDRVELARREGPGCPPLRSSLHASAFIQVTPKQGSVFWERGFS